MRAQKTKKRRAAKKFQNGLAAGAQEINNFALLLAECIFKHCEKEEEEPQRVIHWQ